MINWFIVDEIIISALKEDMPYGDVTTDAVIDIETNTRAEFLAKEDGVIAGLDIARRVFELLDDKILFMKLVKDGTFVKKGTVIAEIAGNTAAILKGERTALNILQRLSGIASITKEFCNKIEGTNVKIADTRKTTPGLRMLEKYAVKVGGGSNHRFSLS